MRAKFLTGVAIAAAFFTSMLQAPNASAQQMQRQRDASAPAQMQMVQGQILDIRQIPVRGADARNVLVLIRTQQGNKVVMDLGDRLRDVRFQRGEHIRARGEVVKVGDDRPLLMVESFQYQGRMRETNRVAYFQGGRDGTRGMSQAGYGSSGR